MRTVAAILAGGLGTRLRPVLGGIPKALAPIGGRPFLSYELDQLAQADIGSVVICAGHLGRRFQAGLEPRTDALSVVLAHEEWPMGTAGALRRAVDLLDGDMVLVMNGDSYVDIDLSQFCEWQEAQGYQATLLATRVENSSNLRTVDIDSLGTVTGLHEKRQDGGPAWISAGVWLLPRSWITALPADTPLSLEADVMPYWLKRGIGGYRVHAPYLNIGSPNGMARAPAFFETVRRRLGSSGTQTTTAGGERFGRD